MNKSPKEEKVSEGYKIRFSDYQHQDKQLWQMNIYFFGVHAGLFAIFFKLLSIQDNYFVSLAFIVSILGMVLSIIWLFSSNKIKRYIENRLNKLKEMEKAEDSLEPKIWTGKEEQVKGCSIKWVYTILVPMITLIGWFMTSFYFILKTLS